MKTQGKDLKFVLIGGGSFGWSHRLITDMACLPALHGMHIVLQDINPDALSVTLPLCQKLANQMLGADFRLEATTDLRSALKGADFVGLTISTGSEEANLLDQTIPRKHGVLQTVGDTVGPGGWSRALRNIPVVVDIIRTVEEIAPDAWFMNYSNPMTVLTRTMQKVSRVKSVGLCHELQGLLLHLAYYFGVDWQKDIKVKMAGINHLIWILALDVCGHDGLELLKQYIQDPEGFKPLGPRVIPEELIHGGGVNPNQRIKFDMLMRTGYLTGAGDAHTAEFFSHYLKDEETMKRWGYAPDKRAHTFAHIHTYEKRKQHALELLEGKRQPFLKHSHEHASRIVAALIGAEENLLTPINTGNIGQVDNLPRQAVLETMALVNRLGVTPLPVGNLPEFIQTHLMRHIPVQEMIVEAGLTGNKELAILALSCDPLVPGPDVAARIAADVFESFQEWLPQFNGKWSL